MERKPWPVILSFAKPMPRKAALMVFYDIGRSTERSDGNTKRLYSVSCSTVAMRANACLERGTAWTRRILVLCAGMVHNALSKSKSAHSAWRSSPERTNTCGSSRRAVLVLGCPSNASIARNRTPTPV